MSDNSWRISQDRDFIFIGLVVVVLGGLLAGVGTLLAAESWSIALFVGFATALTCAVIYFGAPDND